MGQFKCWECGHTVKKWIKICKNCWAELIRKTEEPRKKSKQSFLEPIKEMQGWYWFKQTKHLKWWHIFNYDEHQIFYKKNTPSVSSFYRIRIIILIIWLCLYIFPGLLVLITLFWQRKPRDRCLLVSEEWIWKLDQPSSFSYKWYYFLEKPNVWDIIINWDKIIIKKKWNDSKYFSFSKIREIEKLKYSLKKYWYKFEG